MFLISVWLGVNKVYPWRCILPVPLKITLRRTVHRFLLDFWLVAILQSFSPYPDILTGLCLCILDMIPSIMFIESMYPISYIDVMMVDHSPYFRNGIVSFIFKQDYFGTVAIISILDHFIQHVSFIISNQPEVSIPRNDGDPKWLAKGVVV